MINIQLPPDSSILAEDNVHAESVFKEDSYYIILTGRWSLFIMDESIASRLNIKKDDYINILIEKFNGKKNKYKSLIYDTKEDCDKACEWIESILVMQRLGN